jgi:hypothetical protein
VRVDQLVQRDVLRREILQPAARLLVVPASTFTDAAKVTERFRRPNFGSLEIQVTVDDQKAFTKPRAVTNNQRTVLDTELIGLVCDENISMPTTTFRP